MEALIVDRCGDRVTVSAKIGKFIGRWCSEGKAELRKYILELDTEEILFPEAIQISHNHIFRIDYINDLIILNGFVVEIQDQVMFLKLDKTLLMVELSRNFNFSIFVNNFVCVKLHGLDLYDTGVC